MKHFATAVSLIVALCAPTGQSSADEALDSRFWDLILQADADVPSSELDKLDQLVKSGEVGYDDQRSVYMLFATTHPEAGEFISAWYRSEPTSRHAMAAEMRRLHHIAWTYRGTKYVPRTAPEALELFSKTPAEAQSIAQELFGAHPDFVPGTDGVLIMMRGGGGKGNARSYLRTVFEHTPNKGSLRRAITAFYPNWGGEPSQIHGLCNEFAPQVPPEEAYDAELCIAEEMVKSRFDGWAARIQTNAIIDKRGDEVDYYARLLDAVYDRLDLERAQAAFDQRTRAHPEIAETLAQRTGLFRLRDAEIRRDATESREKLERDPLAPGLLISVIGDIQGKINAVRLEQDRIISEAAEALEAAGDRDPEQRRAFRTLLAEETKKADETVAGLLDEIGPLAARLPAYGRLDPDAMRLMNAYRKYSGAIIDDDLGERIAGLKNAIVASRYEKGPVQDYYMELQALIKASRLALRNGGSINERENLPAEPILWEYDCDYMRSMRLLAEICFDGSGDRIDGCQWSPSTRDRLEMEADAAAAGGLCPALRHLPIDQPRLDLNDMH